MASSFTRSLGALVVTAALGVTHSADAADSALTLGEVAPPPASFVSNVAGLRAAAESEIRQVEPTLLKNRRRVIVSIAMTRTAVDPVSCTVNATLRDAKTGTMLLFVEAGAHAQGSGASVREQVAQAAVRSAVRRAARVLPPTR